jgi:hypothetical protein
MYLDESRIEVLRKISALVLASLLVRKNRPCVLDPTAFAREYTAQANVEYSINDTYNVTHIVEGNLLS